MPAKDDASTSGWSRRPDDWKRHARASASERLTPLAPEAAAGPEAGAPAPQARAQRVGRTRLLPFHVLLARGQGALELFAPGPFDELSFFQRVVGPSSHSVEYLIALDPRDAGSERFRPFARVDLDPARARPWPELARCEALAAALRASQGPLALPKAKTMLPARTWAHHPERGGSGLNRVAPPPGRDFFRWSAGRSYSYADMLEVIRHALDDAERIAWVEGAFKRPPAAGEVVHRYYLGARLRPWIVRHEAEAKRLFAGEPSRVDGQRGLVIYPTGGGSGAC